MTEEPASVAEARQSSMVDLERSEDTQDFVNGTPQETHAYESLSSAPERSASKKPLEITDPMGLSTINRAGSQSSNDEEDDDDRPLRDVRLTRQTSEKREATTRARQEPAKPSSKKFHWRNRKAGAKPISAKPVSKNDMKAKLQTIRDIEKYWGKGFIKAYIPKCHRPLTKRKGGTKRSVYRTHESDPKNWLPSVLKAVLMVAEQTSDKAHLKKAMNEVVRYRIKNTGNRKPQLVTTDFDVIEDIIIRGWTCKASFEIRYKHLLMAQTRENHVTQEEIDNIMWAGSGEEDEDEGESEDKVDFSKIRYKAEENDSGIDEGEHDDNDEDGSSTEYIQKAPHYPPVKVQKSKSSKQANLSKQQGFTKSMLPPPYQQTYPGYGATMNGYGGPPGYGPSPPYGYPPQQMKGYPPSPYGPYGIYGPYGYGPQHSGKDSRGRHPGLPPCLPPPHGGIMSPSLSLGGDAYSGRNNKYHSESNQQREMFSPFGQGKRSKRQYNDENDTAAYGAHHRMCIDPNPNRMHKTNIKREPGLEHDPIDLDDHNDGPTNYYGPSRLGNKIEMGDLGRMGGMGVGLKGDVDNSDEANEPDEHMRLELEAAEAEARVKAIKAKMAAAKKGSRLGGDHTRH